MNEVFLLFSFIQDSVDTEKQLQYYYVNSTWCHQELSMAKCLTYQLYIYQFTKKFGVSQEGSLSPPYNHDLFITNSVMRKFFPILYISLWRQCHMSNFMSLFFQQSEKVYRAKRGQPSARTIFKPALGWRQKLVFIMLSWMKCTHT